MRRRSSLRSTSLGKEYDLGDETRLAWRSVRTYVTAITDLYRTQKALGMNTHPSPREDNVREYLKSLQRRDAQRDRENYADKGRDTLLDGYSESEFEREGSTRCMPLIFTTRAGKQNQHGRLETAGAYRNRNPLICILGGLVLPLVSLGSRYEDQIRRAGRWNQEQMVGCYLNSLPRKFMRTMAGHPPQAGCFEIRRAGVTPPEVLLDDLARAGQLARPVRSRYRAGERPGSDGPVWNHPVFRHPAYAPFAHQLSDFVLEEERPPACSPSPGDAGPRGLS
ncbi:centromere DNA-binding protein complex CBF3 subunit [Hirsutella rhossiliensis]|uniref:Centromere DNA-binding protein complex CBF3 subunit n=1 Tax=Hirsutella rhossiliensis TaxID=111463 RepID=A0A9P8SFB6_9HYPO|nr:centromere DNA-binding protein complex CBF3 subunit [Hirsutella rhossiliensis]KAH0959270.1 centromere DNA-binding protein complex CBF3 subunit [Hirsutella rhossiliensis]